MIRSFDVRRYLEDRNIPYRESGKNVSMGWIGLACPWCSDPSHHLGVRLSDKRMSCWRCGPKGSALRLIMKIDRLDTNRAWNVVREYHDPLAPTTIDIRLPSEGPIQLPDCASTQFMGIHKQWLTTRRFTPPEHYIQKYRLQCCYVDPHWGYRIIVPIYLQHRLAAWVGVDVTGEAEVPYLNSPIEESLIDPKHCLYNFDRVNKVAIVVEGITDVWRLGDGAVCTLGTVWTREQWLLLDGLHTVYIIFDAEPEAQESAKRLEEALTYYVNHVRIVELDQGDPDDLTEEEVKNFRREIFGRE